MVIGVPNPSPGDTQPLQEAIETALRSAEKEGVRGALVTPYVLAMVEKLTQGNQFNKSIIRRVLQYINYFMIHQLSESFRINFMQ